MGSLIEEFKRREEALSLPAGRHSHTPATPGRRNAALYPGTTQGQYAPGA